MIGTIIKGRYKLEKKIGGGGMAEVYKATDLFLNTNVAVKILRQQFVNEDDFIKRFQREAQSVASLSHQNVVSIFDVGQEEEIYFIVMEYVSGQTLKELIQEKGQLTVEETIDIAKKIADALDHAHQNKIVHRDIKPHNILIGPKGQVKVTDFGIARAISQATITHTGSVLGSVHYLSPEQARGGFTDEKSDLYSLGIVMYEMVTGTLPFFGDSPITIALKHLQETFIYPSELAPDLPQSVENIILKALVKDPSKRYSSAKKMLADLETALNPERLNEPLINVESDGFDDEQKTLIIPAIRGNYNEDTIYPIQSRKSKKNGIIKFISIFTVILALVIFGYFGFQILQAKFIVPEVKVPSLEGQNAQDAIKELEGLNLSYEIVERNDPVVSENYVIRQEPYQGSVIKVNQIVTLYISLGKEKIAMPDLTNKQKGQAKFLLTQQGFLNENMEIIEEYNEDTPSGLVFKQEPLAKELVVPEDQKITLFISKGQENFAMPNLIGLSETEATALLLANGLEVGKVERDFSFDQPKDRVYRQFPFDPGKQVAVGDKVDIYISLGYPEETKKVYTEMLVLVFDNNETEISIFVRDSRDRDILWKRETISSTKFYNEIELLLLPGDRGTVSVYKDGKLYQSKTVK